MAELQTPPPAKKKLPVKAAVILLVVMAVEGAVVVAWLKFTGPRTAHGSEQVATATEPMDRTVEMKILDFRAPNTRTGKLWYYEIEVYIECDKDKAGLVESICKRRDAAIREELSMTVRRADPQHLQGEPELQTLRRQFHARLTEIFGEGLIQKVRIPRCAPVPM